MKTHTQATPHRRARAGALTLTGAHAQPATTSDSVETRIGTLSFEKGYPTPETARKVYDEMDFQRAVQAFLWAFPAVSFESIRVVAKRDLGADDNDLAIADHFVDTKGVWLTANDTTIYALANINLGQAGPVVIEIPPGPTVGLICDFWQRAITDVGMTGPDQGQGGKFLLLPPGYDGEGPQDGYHVLRTTMSNYKVMIRGIVVNNDIPGAVQRIRQLKIYPWSARDNPKALKVVSMSGKPVDSIPPDGIEYWVRLATFINNNPVHERDRFFMAMLKPLGIEKGKPFQPDARQRAILEDAARLGPAMARTILFDAEHRFSDATAFPSTYWSLGRAHGSRPGIRHVQPAR